QPKCQLAPLSHLVARLDLGRTHGPPLDGGSCGLRYFYPLSWCIGHFRWLGALRDFHDSYRECFRTLLRRVEICGKSRSFGSRSRIVSFDRSNLLLGGIECLI